MNAVIARFSFQVLEATTIEPYDGISSIGSAATVQAKSNVAVSPSASLAVTVAVPMPGAVGVPETEREEFIDTPAGRPLAE